MEAPLQESCPLTLRRRTRIVRPLRFPVARSLTLVASLAVLTLASAAEQPGSDARPELGRHESKPAEPADRPAPNDGSTINDSAPAVPPPAAAPARDAAKPTRPAAKQRPAWPPPPELIS